MPSSIWFFFPCQITVSPLREKSENVAPGEIRLTHHSAGLRMLAGVNAERKSVSNVGAHGESCLDASERSGLREAVDERSDGVHYENGE